MKRKGKNKQKTSLLEYLSVSYLLMKKIIQSLNPEIEEYTYKLEKGKKGTK